MGKNINRNVLFPRSPTGEMHIFGSPTSFGTLSGCHGLYVPHGKCEGSLRNLSFAALNSIKVRAVAWEGHRAKQSSCPGREKKKPLITRIAQNRCKIASKTHSASNSSRPHEPQSCVSLSYSLHTSHRRETFSGVTSGRSMYLNTGLGSLARLLPPSI